MGLLRVQLLVCVVQCKNSYLPVERRRFFNSGFPDCSRQFAGGRGGVHRIAEESNLQHIIALRLSL
jgi:hypothetical protein